MVHMLPMRACLRRSRESRGPRGDALGHRRRAASARRQWVGVAGWCVVSICGPRPPTLGPRAMCVCMGGRLSVPGARSEALRPVMEAARTDVQLPACARGLGRQCGAPFEPKRRRAAGGGGVSRCGRVRSLATAPKLFNIPMLHSQCLQSSRRDGGSSGSRRQDLPACAVCYAEPESDT